MSTADDINATRERAQAIIDTVVREMMKRHAGELEKQWINLLLYGTTSQRLAYLPPRQMGKSFMRCQKCGGTIVCTCCP